MFLPCYSLPMLPWLLIPTLFIFHWSHLILLSHFDPVFTGTWPVLSLWVFEESLFFFFFVMRRTWQQKSTFLLVLLVALLLVISNVMLFFFSSQWPILHLEFWFFPSKNILLDGESCPWTMIPYLAQASLSSLHIASFTHFFASYNITWGDITSSCLYKPSEILRSFHPSPAQRNWVISFHFPIHPSPQYIHWQL